MTMPTTTTIRLPTAADLDVPLTPQGRSLAIYLVPAEETDDEEGCARLALCERYRSGDGSPEPAHHHRWQHLATVRAGAIGETVLAVLEAHRDDLIEIAQTYRGRTGELGRRGCWDEAACDDVLDRLAEIERAMREGVRTAWDAADWYQPAPLSWVELCARASIARSGSIDDALLAVSRAMHEDARTHGERLDDASTIRHAEWLLAQHLESLRDQHDDEDSSDSDDDTTTGGAR